MLAQSIPDKLEKIDSLLETDELKVNYCNEGIVPAIFELIILHLFKRLIKSDFLFLRRSENKLNAEKNVIYLISKAKFVNLNL